MADNDLDFFIMDGIQTFPQSEPEPIPVPIIRSNPLLFSSLNAPPINPFRQSSLQPLADYDQPPMIPFTKYQQPVVSAPINYFHSNLSAQEIMKTKDSGFTGVQVSSSSYLPTLNHPRISNGDNGNEFRNDRDFSFLSTIPCKVAEMNPQVNDWKSKQSSIHHPVSDEIFCSTGIVSLPHSNSGANGFEEEERTISPPVNFGNISSHINANSCSTQTLSKNVSNNQYSSPPINFLDVVQMELKTYKSKVTTKMVKENTVTISKSLKNFVTNNKDLPSTVTISKCPRSTTSGNINNVSSADLNTKINPTTDYMLVNTSNATNEYKLVKKLKGTQSEKGISCIPNESINEIKKTIPFTFGKSGNRFTQIVTMRKQMLKIVEQEGINHVADTSLNLEQINLKKPEVNNSDTNVGSCVKSNGKPEPKLLNDLRVVLTSLDLENIEKMTNKPSIPNLNSEGKTNNFIVNPSKSKEGVKRRESEESISSKSDQSLEADKPDKPVSQPTSQIKKKNTKSDMDVTFLQVRDLRERTKNLVAHTVDDSDSDVCIVDEEIKNPDVVRRRGRGRPSLKQLNYLRRLKASKQMECSECKFKTTSLQQLQAHEAAHPKGRKIKCSKCDFVTRLKSCMIYHAVMHSGGKKFRCCKCTFKTDSLESFLAHEAKKLPCPKCNTDCHTQKELEKHVFKAHGVGKFVCDICPFTTRDVKRMNAHVHKAKSSRLPPLKQEIKVQKDTGTKEDKFPCTDCFFTAPSIYLLNKHIKLIHSHDEDVQIKKRQKRYRTNRTAVRRNTSTKKEDYSKYQTQFGEYLCPHCRYVSDELLFFVNHLKTHSKEGETMFTKPAEIYKCSFCEFETEFEKMVESHLLTHTEHDSDFDGDDDDATTNDLNEEVNFLECVETKKYQCEICEYQTNFEKAFKRHKSLHMRKNVFNIMFSSLF